MKALEIKNLCKSFGGNRVLSNVSISVEEGERRAIIGPNGAGKTTLFNVISGLQKPDSGQIFLFEKDITKIPAYSRARQGLARTFQKNNLFSTLSLQDNVRLASRTSQSRMCPEELLEKFGLRDKMTKKLGELSYGEQRQAELLMALAQSPRVLLLDEPTAGMSSLEAEAISTIIEALPKEITLLLIEHNMRAAFSIADQVTVLHRGEVLCTDSKDMIRTDAKVQEIYLGTDEEEE